MSRARRLKVIVEADGGSRGNPGTAGYGAVVSEAATGEVLLELAERIGVATNNVAEYRGMIAGLRAAADLGAVEVEVRMDSKLVVEQMSGRWQIKHPGLRPLAAEAAGLVGRFETVRFVWVPREENRRADALANAAMDGRPLSDLDDLPSSSPALADPVLGPALADPVIHRDAAVGSTDPLGRRDAPGAADPLARRDALGGPVGPGPSRPAAGQPSGRGGPSGPTGRSGSVGPGPGGAGSWSPPAAGTGTRVILVRHGQTALNAQRRYSGRGDVDLSPAGLDQARAVARRLAATISSGAVVVSSPLSRCVRTAEEIAAQFGPVPVQLEPDLIECDFGVWEGLTFAEVRRRWPDEMQAWLASPAVAPPDGESFDAVGARVAEAVSRLRAEHLGETLVLVSHVSPIKLVLRDALAATDAFLHRMFLDATGVSIVDYYADGGIAVRTVNDTAHLPPQ